MRKYDSYDLLCEVRRLREEIKRLSEEVDRKIEEMKVEKPKDN